MSSSKPPKPSEAQDRLAATQALAMQQSMMQSDRQFALMMELAAQDRQRGDQQFAFQRGLQEEAAARDRFFFDRYKNTTQKYQDKLFAEVDAYDADAEGERRAGAARADITGAFEAQRGMQRRNMESRGLNPASGAYIASMTDMDTDEALAKAAASTLAFNAAKAEKLNLYGMASGLGDNLGASGKFQASAIDYGNSALQAGGRGLATTGDMFRQQAGLAQTWGGAANNTMNSLASQNAARANSGVNWGQTAASALSTYGAIYLAGSDRRLKTDIRPVGKLDNGLTVYSYRYKAGGPHVIGVMADEVEKVAPHAVVKNAINGRYDAVNYAALGA